MKLRILSIVGAVLMVVTIVTLLFLQSLLANSAVTIALQIAGIVLMVWARMTFGLRSFHLAANPTDGGLVTTGPYRFIRHPVYVAVLLFITGAVIANLSVPSIMLGIVMLVGVALRIYSEEKLLAVNYPDFMGYVAKSKRVIPFIF